MGLLAMKSGVHAMIRHRTGLCGNARVPVFKPDGSNGSMLSIKGLRCPPNADSVALAIF
jgi:hypothetical protein